MKNKMHKSRWLPVLFALLMLANNASGQNFIRETMSIKDDHSLIRSKTENTWILYSKSHDTNYFFHTNSSNNTAPYLSFTDNINITDFEIFHDTVFFCGSTQGETPNAVFGLFPLTGFPSSAVWYHVYTGLKSFDKMAMLSTAGTTHAALTASYQNGYGTMVDIIKQSTSSWLFCVADRENMRELYDDVAALESHVVFSSRSFAGQSPKYGQAQIVYHSLPVVPGNTYLSVNPTTRYFNTSSMSATSPIVLKAWESSNTFLAATTTSGSQVSVSQFSGYNYYASVETPSQTGLVIRDMGFNDLNLESELLVNVQNADAVGSIIYHLEHYHFMQDTILFAHYYVNQFLYALDKAGFNDMLQVSCGHWINSPDLRLYRYRYPLYNCAVRKTHSSRHIEYEVKYGDLTVAIDPYLKTLLIQRHDMGTITFHTICP